MLENQGPGLMSLISHLNAMETNQQAKLLQRYKFPVTMSYTAQETGEEWEKPQCSLWKSASITLKSIQFRKQLVSKCDEKKKIAQSIESIGIPDTLTDGAISIELSHILPPFLSCLLVT